MYGVWAWVYGTALGAGRPVRPAARSVRVAAWATPQDGSPDGWRGETRAPYEDEAVEAAVKRTVAEAAVTRRVAESAGREGRPRPRRSASQGTGVEAAASTPHWPRTRGSRARGAGKSWQSGRQLISG
jgi:hypothetical protein